jgi:hypothetical protein
MIEAIQGVGAKTKAIVLFVMIEAIQGVLAQRAAGCKRKVLHM